MSGVKPFTDEKNKLTLELLDLIDEMAGLRRSLDNLISAGSMDLSSAKYQLGPENVSHIQYDNRMKSSWEVEELSNLRLDLLPAKNEGNLVDPLNWFGIFVPDSLRSSQKSFKAALVAIIEIQNLNLRMEHLRQEILKEATV